MVTNEGPHGDIDASPSKTFLLENKEAYPRLFERAFGKRPQEELYDCRKDPDQLDNLAADPAHGETLGRLSEELTAYLKASGDPRETTGRAPWDKYRYHGRSDWKVAPE
jgi:hypothetical protein